MNTYRNILLLTDCFSDTAAGAEKQIFELAKELSQSNYTVTIASLDHCGSAIRAQVESLGIRLIVFRVRRIYGISGILEGIKFFKFLKEEKIDIVQTYHFGSDIWGTVIARLAGINTIISNRRDMGFWRKSIHVQAYRWVNRWVKRIVVNAGPIKTMVAQSERIPLEKIEVIYNGVEFDRPAHPLKRTELRLKQDDIVIAHVANLKEVKGHIYLLEAIRTILEKHKNIHVLLIGEDMYSGLLQNKAEFLGIQNHLSFLGKRTDVSSLLALADICVLPSLSEGLSNAILEYMVAGKPVIATDVGGNSELVEDSVTGFLVPKEDVKSLSKALLRLIEDKDLRINMGAEGRRKVVANFSIETMARCYDHLYNSLLPRKIRILHFISSCGFFGAENVLLNIAQGFNNEHFISCVAALRDPRNPDIEVINRAQAAGIPVHTFKSRGSFDLKVINELRDYINAHKIDILHTHNYKSDILGVMAARGTSVSLVSTAHGFTGMNSKVSWYEQLDQWFLKKYFKRTVVVTSKMLPDFPVDKRRIIGNGINFKKFEQPTSVRHDIRRQHHILDGDILIGTVGRLSVEKDQELLITVMADICRQQPHVKVMLIGDGPKAEDLKALIRRHHMEKHVILTGLIPNPAPYYQAFDIFVLSSRTEGVPLTVLEAMASRIPVVATRVGGIPEIITDGTTGLLVDPQNSVQLRQAIETLIADAQKRKMLCENAFHFAKENYSIDRMNRLYYDVYQEAIKP